MNNKLKQRKEVNMRNFKYLRIQIGNCRQTALRHRGRVPREDRAALAAQTIAGILLCGLLLC